MHILDLYIKYLVKDCFISFGGSQTLCTKDGGSGTADRTFQNPNDGMLLVCQMLLVSIEIELPLLGLYVDSWKGEVSSYLNALFPSSQALDRLEAKITSILICCLLLIVNKCTKVIDISRTSR